MEREEATPSSKGLYEEDRGAGGKFRKPTVRKPPITPYARPSTAHQTRQKSEGGGGGWLSKLVNPATRLISGGATRLFPSFFSKPFPASDIESPEVKQDVDDENPEHLSNIQICRSTERGQGPATKWSSEPDENVKDKLGNSSDRSSFSEIEQMMKQKTFSRDDINRLTEILRSRIDESSDNDEREQKKLNMTKGAEATGRSLVEENVRTLVVEKQSMHWQENVRASVVEKQVSHSDKVMGVTSTPSPFGRDKVGASPIDIAKAYMGARTSELGLSSPSVILKDERTPLPTDGFSLKSSVPSPSPKSSICWPGAKVQDQHAFQTPQTQRGRIGLHNLPRTPYSRAVHSRSTSKLPNGGDRSINISSNYWKQSRTPIFGDSQVTRTRSSDDGFGSVGPIRRIRHKFGGVTPTKGASSSHHANSMSFRVEGSDAPKGFSPMMVKQNMEPGASTSNSVILDLVDSKASSSSIGVSAVHPQSSEIARKILEGLDRTIITPQEKSAELKLATSWRKTTPSELTTTMLNGQFNEQHVEGSHLQRSSHITQQFSAQRNEVTGSSLCEFEPEQTKNHEATDVVNPNTLTSNGASSNAGFGADSVGCSASPLMDFKKTHIAHEVTGKQSENNQPLPVQNHIDGRDFSRLFHRGADSQVLNEHKKPAAHTFGNKPALTSISIAKSDPKRAVSFDNGSGFTFPVSASSGTLSEPPTPSIMPSFSAIGVPRPLEKPALPPYNFGSKAADSSYSFGSKAADSSYSFSSKAADPSYSFGSKTASRPIVFSFPSTSSSTPSDGSTPKFDFGSDKKSRLSFS